ncbi:MAG: hypothetical protein WDZ90_00725 [Candidatus Paceibacterota bacterium]
MKREQTMSNFLVLYEGKAHQLHSPMLKKIIGDVEEEFEVTLDPGIIARIWKRLHEAYKLGFLDAEVEAVWNWLDREVKNPEPYQKLVEIYTDSEEKADE